MIAAELSHNEQERASQLLARAEARYVPSHSFPVPSLIMPSFRRRFPEAVMARISGIRHGELL